MGKIHTLFFIMLPLTAAAQFGEGFGPPGDRDMQVGQPPGDMPPAGGNPGPLDMIGTLKSHEDNAFDSLFTAADIMNRKTEILFAMITSQIPIPSLSKEWSEITSELKTRETQEQMNAADEAYRNYLVGLEACQTSLDSMWANDVQRQGLIDYLNAYKDSLMVIKDSIQIAVDMNETACMQLDQLLGHAKDMQSRIASAPAQFQSGASPKEMIYSLQGVIGNMEKDKIIAERQSKLAQDLLMKLKEVL